LLEEEVVQMRRLPGRIGKLHRTIEFADRIAPVGVCLGIDALAVIDPLRLLEQGDERRRVTREHLHPLQLPVEITL
jgi:hypothetical protein